MALNIIFDKCVGCGACVKVCPYDALEMVDKKAVVNANCTLCGACIPACKFDAMVLERAVETGVDVDAYRNVWVYIQPDGDGVHHVSLELVNEGRKLADELEVELGCAVLGNDTSGLIDELSHYSEVDRIYTVESPVLEHYRTQPYAKALAALSNKHHPEIMLIGATTTGRDLAGNLATILLTGLTADCTDLGIEQESRSLLQTRPAFGGNIMATIKSSRHRPQMATVRPKVFAMPERGENKRDIEVIREDIPLDESEQKVTVLEWIPSEDSVSIVDANVIVSGGRGIGGPENFEMLQELADLLDGAVGASRAVVDAGWIDYAHQVGQTGRTVRPNIYIACGISGAVQHVAGMKTSDMIIAINKDPEAPIFKVANYGYVGDVMEIVPRMIKELKARIGK